MKPFITLEQNINRDRYSFIFILQVVLMLGLGLATLYSGSLYYAERFFGNPLYFVLRQFRNLLAGGIGLVFFSFFSLEQLRKFLPYLLIAGLIFVLLPFVPGIGFPRNGANRWIALGKISLQPSEFIKLLLILFLANFFDKKAEQLEAPLISILPPIFMIMFYAAGGPLLWFLKGLIVMIPCAVLMVVTSTYRMKRVLSFLVPDHDPLGAGYQINAALDALASGGITGSGFGNGVHKISSVPEIYSDFIFVVWAEEMGFAGVCAYLLLIFLFAFTAYTIAFQCTNRFGCLLAFGAASAIVVQSFLNLGVVVRLVPATGIPLPFFSFGGSSLITTLCLCGLIINVSSYSKRRQPHV